MSAPAFKVSRSGTAAVAKAAAARFAAIAAEQTGNRKHRLLKAELSEVFMVGLMVGF
jgi:hypothetical protein